MMKKNKKVGLVLAVMLMVSFSMKAIEIEEGGSRPELVVEPVNNMATVEELEAQERFLQEEKSEREALLPQQVRDALPISPLSTIVGVDETGGSSVVAPFNLGGFTAADIAAVERINKEPKFSLPKLVEKKQNRLMQWLKNRLITRAVNKVLSNENVKRDVKSISSDKVQQRAIVRQIVGDFRDGITPPIAIMDLLPNDPLLKDYNSERMRSSYLKLIRDVFEAMGNKGVRTNLMKKNKSLFLKEMEKINADAAEKAKEIAKAEEDALKADAARKAEVLAKIKADAAKKAKEIAKAQEDPAKKAKEIAKAQEGLAGNLNAQTLVTDSLIYTNKDLLEADSKLNTEVKGLQQKLADLAGKILEAQKASLNSLGDATDQAFETKFQEYKEYKEYEEIKAKIKKLIEDAIKKKEEEDAAEKIASQLAPSIISTSVRNVVEQAQEAARLDALETEKGQARLEKIKEMYVLRRKSEKEKEAKRLAEQEAAKVKKREEEQASKVKKREEEQARLKAAQAKEAEKAARIAALKKAEAAKTAAAQVEQLTNDFSSVTTKVEPKKGKKGKVPVKIADVPPLRPKAESNGENVHTQPVSADGNGAASAFSDLSAPSVAPISSEPVAPVTRVAAEPVTATTAPISGKKGVGVGALKDGWTSFTTGARNAAKTARDALQSVATRANNGLQEFSEKV